jgi:4'-phosphopantetheinyl transferase
MGRPGDGDVHIWSMRAHWGERDVDASALAILDDAERTRAARFRSEQDRDRFVSHHAFVRRVLAGYLGVAPAAVAILAASHGKPEVDLASGISFNTSRSGGLSVVAVSAGGVGVDVERLRPIDDADEVADTMFTEAERRLLRSVPPGSRSETFLALWTRKEAVVKAFGMGLSVPLDSFDVCGPPSGGPEPWRGSLGSDPFIGAELDVPAGWVGSVCVIGTRLSLRYADAGSLVG